MMKKFSTLLLSAVLILLYGFKAKSNETLVAVVVDKTTYNSTRSSIDNYLTSIEEVEGRRALLITEDIDTPQKIRAKLLDLYRKSNLEGAVFIGDIPVPMIRDAHHLTTAFKMDPKRDWKDSSVPSDRYYDDFDLEFNYLSQDKDVPSYFYFSLAPNSTQYVSSDIYSGRIKAPNIEGVDRYEAIAKYLDKVVREKREARGIERVLHFAGHGYNSNSMNARIDESVSLSEHFPLTMSRRGFDLEFIDYTFDPTVRRRLLSSLSSGEVDLAILHHHGSEDVQYFNGTPMRNTPDGWIELTRNFFRSKIRNAKDSAKTKQYYIDRHNVPMEWVSDSFNPENIEKDSIYAAEKDVIISDLEGFKPTTTFVILDACFNGSYHLDDYLAANYIFNDGRCVAVKANSVNTLQDTWTNELIGILDFGVSIGNWSRGQMTLESHIIGDPTFIYKPYAAGAKLLRYNLDRDITLKRDNEKYWRKVLKNSSHPDVKVLAINMLYDSNNISSDELLSIQKYSESPIVRLAAFMRLKDRADDKLFDALMLGCVDAHELVQRLSLMTAAKTSDPRFTKLAVDNLLNPLISKRLAFQNNYLVSSLNGSDLVKIMSERAYSDDKIFNFLSKEDFENKIKSIERGEKGFKSDLAELLDSNGNLRNKRFTIRAQRNLCNARLIDALLKMIEDSSIDESLKIEIIETLGWYRYSYRKAEIIDFCEKSLSKTASQPIKDEFIKTINRLK